MNGKAAVSKEAERGCIIRVLAYNYPNVLLPNELSRKALTESETSNIVTNLNYLYQKGYVQFSGNHNIYSPSIQNQTVKLTAKGIDLLEDLIQDPGVKLR